MESTQADLSVGGCLCAISNKPLFEERAVTVSIFRRHGRVCVCVCVCVCVFGSM